MTALEIALAYIGRGWNPVPVNYRSKKPSLGTGWQLRIIDANNAPQHFNGAQMNIGVMLGPSSHGLTDIDLDCEEARAVAPYVLPRTGAIFGRASSRAAHRLYYTDLAVNADKAVLIFNDPTTGGRVLELRIGGASGAQTVFPGSTHEEGEAIAWEESGEPASVDGNDLARRVNELAAYSLIARYWPAPGLKARHSAALIVGGFLARAGRSPQEIKIAAEAIARAANDNEWRNRREAAEDAAKAFHAAEHAYGLTGMRKQFGEEVADQIAEWLGYVVPANARKKAQHRKHRNFPRFLSSTCRIGTMSRCRNSNGRYLIASHLSKPRCSPAKAVTAKARSSNISAQLTRSDAIGSGHCPNQARQFSLKPKMARSLFIGA